MIRVAVAAAALAFAAPALACRCHEPSLAQAYRGADAVVSGRIAAVRTEGRWQSRLQVAIERSWKRRLGDTIVVGTATSCALVAQPGQRFLLFLREDGHGGYYTRRCLGDRAEPTPALLDQVDALAAPRSR